MLDVRRPQHVTAQLTYSTTDLFNDTPELASHTLTFLTQERREWLAGRHVLANWDMPELVAKADEITEKNLLKFRCIVD